MSSPRGYAEIVAHYGDPLGGRPARFAPDRPGRLVVDKAWKDASLGWAKDLPAKAPPVYCHHLIVEPLRRALARSAALGWAPSAIECWAPRLKRGVDQVSIHCFGAAVDLDPDDNPLIVGCGPRDPRRFDPKRRTIPDAVVDAFADEGWFWGGNFSSRFDPMHFQWATGY